MARPGGVAVLLLVVVALIVYGSLYPFNFASYDPHAFARFIAHWNSDGRLSDLLGNVALFLPFGFAAFQLRPTGRILPRAGLVLLSGLGLSFVLQALQTLLPSRIAAISDVFWNVIGTALGIVAAIGLRRIPGSMTARIGSVRDVKLVLVLLWFAAETVPFVPGLGWQEVKDSLKPLLLHPQFSLGAFALEFAGALLIRELLAELDCARARLWFPGVLALVLLLKVGVIDRAVDVSVTAAFLLALPAAWASSKLPTRTRIFLLFWALLGAFSLEALVPFEFDPAGRSFGWVPFASVLQGSLIVGVTRVFELLFVFGAICWSARRQGARLGAVVAGLAVWALLLESVQTLMVSRVPEITPVVMAVLGGWMVARLPFGAGTHAAVVCPERGDSSMTRRQARSGPRRGRAEYLFTLIVAVALAVALEVVIRLPGVPYNVRELFLGGFPAKLVFAFAILWLGTGAALTANRMADSERAWLVMPIGVVGCSLILLMLLSASVTQESIMDIAGSNNLYWFVINKGIWGSWGARLFEALGPGVVAAIERPVRFTALVAPLFVAIAVIGAWSARTRRRELSAGWAIPLLVSTGALAWLCKAIAFDWSSTDNLNELIARDGHWGIGGGGYLYLLLALYGASVVVVAKLRRNGRRMLAVAGFSAMALGLGWWLLNAGLEATVLKYDHVFSGTQFLLGPDRTHPLGQATLFLRWLIVFLGSVGVIGVGFRLGEGLASDYRGAHAAGNRTDIDAQPGRAPGHGRGAIGSKRLRAAAKGETLS